MLDKSLNTPKQEFLLHLLLQFPWKKVALFLLIFFTNAFLFSISRDLIFVDRIKNKIMGKRKQMKCCAKIW